MIGVITLKEGYYFRSRMKRDEIRKRARKEKQLFKVFTSGIQFVYILSSDFEKIIKMAEIFMLGV